MAVVLAVGLLAACGNDERAQDGQDVDEFRVVATTTVLGDLTSMIMGEEGDVEVLMGPGQDPHGFAPSARQAGSLRSADLVVANGLGLEEELEDLLESAASDGATVLRLGEHVDPLTTGEEDQHADEDEDQRADEDEHDHEGGLDPHFWLDPVRMADAARALAMTIGQLDGAPSSDWDASGQAVAEDLLAVHEDVESILDAVPEGCRVLVTAHDSLRYFAARYDFEIIGSVIPGTSTQAGASAGHVAELAHTLEEHGIPAVFAETSESSRLAETLASEVGRDIRVVELPAGTLGEPGSDTGTYHGMMTTTARLVADALEDC